MATMSFEKKFVINDPSSIQKILNSFESPDKVSVREVNLKSENEKGIEILKLQLKKLQQLSSKK